MLFARLNGLGDFLNHSDARTCALAEWCRDDGARDHDGAL
jgi:hypothetical protein